MNKIRIIAGKYRGRTIEILNNEDLRPTAMRIRETLFNWLQHEIEGAHTFDPFTGSGALTLEALSRGATKALACDNNPKNLQQLKKTAQKWGITTLDTKQGDALKLPTPQTPFDLIFLDPPYRLNPRILLEKYLNPKWLKPQGKLYIEHNTPLPELSENYSYHKKSHTKTIHFALITQNTP